MDTVPGTVGTLTDVVDRTTASRRRPLAVRAAKRRPANRETKTIVSLTPPAPRVPFERMCAT